MSIVDDDDPLLLPPIAAITTKSQGKVHVYTVEENLTHVSKRKSTMVSHDGFHPAVKRPRMQTHSKQSSPGMELEDSDPADEPVIHSSLAAAMHYANSVSTAAIRPRERDREAACISGEASSSKAGPSQPFSVVIQPRRRNPSYRVGPPTRKKRKPSIVASKRPAGELIVSLPPASLPPAKPTVKSRRGRPPGVHPTEVATHAARLQVRSYDSSPMPTTSRIRTPPRQRPRVQEVVLISPSPSPPLSPSPAPIPSDTATSPQTSTPLPVPPPPDSNSDEVRQLLEENNSLLRTVVDLMQRTQASQEEMRETAKATNAEMKEIRMLLKTLARPSPV